MPTKLTYIIGRNEGDLILADDQSISRQHGKIHINENGVSVEDCGSKYGIFINDDRITNKAIARNKPILLKVGDIVRFGRLKNIWRLERIPIKICTSTIPREQIDQLRLLIDLLNGEIVDVWDDSCTHLTMITVTVTMKVLLSLANGIPIVTPGFWAQYLSSARENATELPNAENFIPPIAEPFILKEKSWLQVNLNRQRLFRGKTFVFMVRKHLRQFESIINLAGGESVSLDEKRVRRNSLLKNHFITVQYTPSLESQSTEGIMNVADYVKEHNRRVINESEIGLAIIHCSIERFCNPDCRMEECLEISSMAMPTTVGNVLVEETPGTSAIPHSTNAPPVTSPTIPESVDLDTDEENNNKKIPKSTGRNKMRMEKKNEKEDKELKRKLPESVKTPSKRQRTNEPHVEETEVNEEQNSIVSQIIPSQNTSQVSQLPQRSQRASNFLRTQKFFNNPMPIATTESQNTDNQPEPLPAGMRKKRALELLKDDSDDDNGNGDLFQFSKVPSKKAKHTKNHSRLEDDDDNNEDLFNFGSLPSMRKSKRPEKPKSQTEFNREDITNSIVHIQREMEIALNVSDVQPVKRSQNGWLKRQIKEESTKVDDDAIKSQAESDSVKIKKEPDDWELTEEEKKQKWLKSIKNAFEVKIVSMNITRRNIDETDNTLNPATFTKNFKAFVKVSKFISMFLISEILIFLFLYRNAIIRHKQLSFGPILLLKQFDHKN